MTLFALEPPWLDYLCAVGGLLVGVIGFAITIWQLRETKRAAEAAEDAARTTLAQSQDAYERFVGAFASRLLSELQDAVNAADWKLAKIRAHDLAELFGALPSTAAHEAAVVAAVDQLREFAQRFAELLAAKKPSISAIVLKDRWRPLLQLLHRHLDQLKKPFRGQPDDQVRADDAAREVPSDLPKPVGEDEGKAGQLDPKPSED